MVNKNLYTLLVCLLLAGCDLIDYHPYDVRISGETDVDVYKRQDNKDSCFCQKHAEDISGTGTTAFMYSYSFGTTA